MRNQFLLTYWVALCLFVGLSQLALAQKRKQAVPESTSIENSEVEVETQRMLIDGMKAYFVEDYKAAIRLFKKIEPAVAQSSSASYMLAKCYTALDSTNQAIYYYEKTIKNNPENQYGYMDLAKEYEKQGKLSDAESMFEKLLTFSPLNPTYLEKLIELTSNQGKWDLALSYLESLEKSEGKSESLSLKKQKVLLKMNKVEEAMKEADISTSTSSNTSSIEVKKVELLFEQKKWGEADKLLISLLQKYPLNSEYLALSATLKYKMGLVKEAIQICVQSIANEKIDLEPFGGLLRELLQEQKISIGDVNVILDATKNRTINVSNADIQSLLVRLNRFASKWEETEKWASKLVKQDEVSFEGWEYLLEANYQLKHFDELIKNAEEATSLFPSQPITWLRLAQGFALNGQWQNAIEPAQMVLDIPSIQMSNQATATLLLGDCYINLNQKEKAIRVWKEGLSLEFDKEKFISRISQYQN